MHQHVVEHAAQRVFRVGILAATSTASEIAMPRLPGESGCAFRMARPESVSSARARDALRAVGLHQRPPIGLLVVGDLDHVDLDFEAEQRAREGERRAPLPGAGLGRQLRDALLLVVESLGDGGVGLVAAGGAHALVFVENARARSERLLEPPRAIERRRSPHPVDVAHRRRDFDMPLAADFLADQRHRKEGREIVRARPAGPCRDAAPAAAGTAGRRRCCTRRGESGPRPSDISSARSLLLPRGARPAGAGPSG